jgi:hypothetical protein
MLYPGRSSGQCTNNLGTRTYDTVLTNNGFAIYNINFPQWKPDSGQLISVKITAAVTSTYGFTLTNVNNVATSYQLSIGQEDQITPDGGSQYTNITPQYVGSYTLQPGQSVSQAPFPFLTNHLSADSITGGTAPFLGTGSINVNYMSFGYTNLWAYNNASYNFGNTINSTTKLSLQYLYCKGGGIVLATNLTRWTASLTAPLAVKLDWSAGNETAGRRYEVQRSSDGRNFTTITTLAATADGNSADYTYTDQLPDGSSGNYYYRLQMIDKGEFSWSTIQKITLDAAGNGLHIYPNPATDHIDIATGTAGGDWQVDILSVSGSLIQENTFLQSSFLHLPFRSHLSAGTYFVRATDLRGQKVLVSSFIVR